MKFFKKDFSKFGQVVATHNLVQFANCTQRQKWTKDVEEVKQLLQKIHQN